MKQRFSKAALREYIARERDRLEEQYRFDSNNGYAQVHGKSVEIQRAYEEYATFDRLSDYFELGER